MSYSPLFGNPKPQYVDNNGDPYVGMRLFFYQANSSTKQDTYTDSTATVANSNPIIIGADGFPESNAMIYGEDNVGYKVVAAPPGSDDPPTSPIWTIDYIYTSGSGIVQAGTTVVNFTAAAGQTLFSLPAGTSYGLGNNSLQVYLGNGLAGGRLRLTKGEDYTETSTSSFTLSYGAVAGDYITAVIGQVLASPSTIAASSTILTSGDSLQDYIGYRLKNIKDAPYSAVGDGIVDDYTSFNTATSLNIEIPSGTYKIGTNLTLSGNLVFRENAILQPASGVTITITGSISANLFQIFDLSAGGLISIANYPNSYPEWFGAVGDYTTNDTTAINNSISSLTKGSVIFNKNYLVTGILLQKSNITLQSGFQPSKIKITSDVIMCTVGDGAGSQITDVGIKDLYFYSDGYGQDNAGLIQINNVKRCQIENVKIISVNASAITNLAVYNGFATSSGAYDITFLNCYVEGTSKSAWHISTGSYRVHCIGCRVDTTGNHDTATYGYSPGFDTTGFYTKFEDCHVISAQGAAFLITAEDSVTYSNPNSLGTIVNSCTGESCRDGMSFESLSSTYFPLNVKISNSQFFTLSRYGINFGAGVIELNNVSVKDIQQMGILVSKGSVTVKAYFNNCTIENWDLADNINYNAFYINTVDDCQIKTPIFRHDQVGVTGTNLYLFGNQSSKTVTNLVIIDPEVDCGTIGGRFRWFSVPSGGYFRYRGTGAPSAGSQAPNGSMYFRDDGVGTADNTYVRRGGTWVGVH